MIHISYVSKYDPVLVYALSYALKNHLHPVELSKLEFDHSDPFPVRLVMFPGEVSLNFEYCNLMELLNQKPQSKNLHLTDSQAFQSHSHILFEIELRGWHHHKLLLALHRNILCKMKN